ncbi:MAG TPA: hypothetical protein DCR14_11900 [Acidimicrobiaceae bacterium]|nr:hypothetical protein [Acidimicrobiaceae bacterium]
MATAAVIIATTVLAALSVLQGLVAAGRPYGRFVWGGQHETLPRRLRLGSVVSIVVYLAMAVVLVVRAADEAGSNSFVSTATWVLVAYFVLGIAVNAASRSRAERLVMTPTCAVLAVCALVIATG